MKTNELLTSKGYNNWKTEDKDYLGIATKYYQRRVTPKESKAVCELNDKLHINVTESKFREGLENYEIYIKAERHGVWCDIKLYALSKEYLESNLIEIEKKLIKLFNLL